MKVTPALYLKSYFAWRSILKPQEGGPVKVQIARGEARTLPGTYSSCSGHILLEAPSENLPIPAATWYVGTSFLLEGAYYAFVPASVLQDTKGSVPGV